MTLQQKPEQRQVRMAFPQRFDPNRLQFAECTLNRGSITRQIKRLTITQGVGTGALSRWQSNLALPFQLQQQRAAGHVLESADPVAPVPASA